MSGVTIFGFGLFVGAGLMYAFNYFATRPEERKALWSRLRAKVSKAIGDDDSPKVP